VLREPTLTLRISFNFIDPALHSEELEAKTQIYGINGANVMP